MLRTRRERTLVGILFAVILVGILSLIRSQPWGRLDIRVFKPSTVDWIVCVRRNANGNGDILMLKPDGEILALTEDEYDDESPNWSPDGKKVVFSSNRRDGVYQLWTIDPDGKGLSQLTIGGGAKQAPVYDRDGEFILHIAQGLVAQIDKKGIHARQLIPLPEQMENVREDFGAVAFRYARRYQFELIAAVQRIDDGELAVLQDLSDTSRQFVLPILLKGERVDIDWAYRSPLLIVAGAGIEVPDGQGEVAQVGAIIRFDLTQGAKKMQAQPLWLSPDNTESALEVAWSPDDSRIAFVLAERQPDGKLKRKGLYTLPSDGGVPTEIVAGEVYDPSWSPDGQYLVFAMGKVGERQIYTVKIDGTELKQRTQTGDHTSPRWSPAR